MKNDKLQAKLDKLKLSQCGAARALGINDRTMRRYCSGKWDVPRMVWLALDALETSNSRQVQSALRDASQP